jgi:hypothetical protein
VLLTFAIVEVHFFLHPPLIYFYLNNNTKNVTAGGKIKKNEMGRACGAYGGGGRRAQGFGGEA